MRPIEQLQRLQDLDHEIALLEQQIEEWAGHRGRLQQGLSQTQQICMERKQALPRQERAVREAEALLGHVEGRLKEVEQRLYSQAIRSPKQADALQSEMEQLRQQRDTAEDAALQRLLELDEMRSLLDQAAVDQQQQTQEYEAFVQEAAAQEAALEEQLGQLRRERSAAAAGISPAALRLYENLRESTGDVAVARVVSNTCQGCHLEVALLTRKAAQGDELVRCEYCGRLLYLP